MSHSKRVGTHKLHCPDTRPHPNPRDQEAFQRKHHTCEVLQRMHKDTVHQKYQSQNLANFNSSFTEYQYCCPLKYSTGINNEQKPWSSLLSIQKSIYINQTHFTSISAKRYQRRSKNKIHCSELLQSDTESQSTQANLHYCGPRSNHWKGCFWVRLHPSNFHPEISKNGLYSEGLSRFKL